MFAVKSYEIILENLYFLFPISEKIWMSNPPNLGAKAAVFLLCLNS